MSQTPMDPIEAAIEQLAPHIDGIIQRINVDEFTTMEFVQALNMDPDAARVYQRLVATWPEADEHRAKMIVHGQVIAQLLRRSPLVEWGGFAHGEPDPYAVPSWWRKTG